MRKCHDARDRSFTCYVWHRYAEVEADLAAREAALKAAQELADELKRKWQEAQDDIMNKLKVINVLKSKNRKLDGQYVV